MKGIVKTVSVVLAITIVSKLLSLLGNQYYVSFYGFDKERFMDAFSYALALPNIVFNSIGTALTTVIIPIFAGYMAVKEREKAFRFADNVIGVSVFLTILLVIIGIALTPYLISLTGFSSDASKEFAIYATRMLLPVMIFYCLNFIFQGILQSLGSFNMPALISVPYSLTVILYVFFWGNRFGLRGLVVATFIGLAFQALILIPPLVKSEYQYHPRLDFKDPEIKKAGKLMLPILIGTSAYQLNMLFNITISANYSEGIVTIVTVVQMLILNMVLSFVYSVTSVIFPRLTELSSTEQWEEFREILQKSLKYVLFFLIPATVIFMALGTEIINLIYGWRRFTQENVVMAGMITTLYAAGVLGHAVKEIMDRALYSIRDTLSPAINGVIVMLLNIGTSLILIRFIGIFGVPVAYSVSLLIGAVVITIMLKRKLNHIRFTGLGKFILQGFGGAVCMFVFLWASQFAMQTFTYHNLFVEKLCKLLIPSLIGGIGYLAYAKLIGMQEVEPLIQKGRAVFRKAKAV